MGGEGEADPVGRRRRRSRSEGASESALRWISGAERERGREGGMRGNINVAMAPEAEAEEETVARAAARQSSTGVE